MLELPLQMDVESQQTKKTAAKYPSLLRHRFRCPVYGSDQCLTPDSEGVIRAHLDIWVRDENGKTALSIPRRRFKLYFDSDTSGLLGLGDDVATLDELAALLQKYPALRAHVYGILRSAPSVLGGALLARAIAAAPDEEGFLLLLKLERDGNIGPVTWQTVERLVNADSFFVYEQCLRRRSSTCHLHTQDPPCTYRRRWSCRFGCSLPLLD